MVTTALESYGGRDKVWESIVFKLREDKHIHLDQFDDDIGVPKGTIKAFFDRKEMLSKSQILSLCYVMRFKVYELMPPKFHAIIEIEAILGMKFDFNTDFRIIENVLANKCLEELCSKSEEDW